MYINLSVGGKCWEQQAYNLGNSVSLWKTCCFCLDANQETIIQSSLTEQGQDLKEVSCRHVFEEEKNERWTELCDRNLTLKLLPEFKGVVVQSVAQIGGIWFAWINRSGSQPSDRSMAPLGIWRKLWFFPFSPSTMKQSCCSIVKEDPLLIKPSLSFKFTQVRTPRSSVRCQSQYSRRMFFNSFLTPLPGKHRGLDKGGGATDWGLEGFYKGKIGIFHLRQVFFFFAAASYFSLFSLGLV